jgi:hypothetical protein
MLTCDTCRRTFRRPRTLLRHLGKHPRYAGGVFCSRECFHASQRRDRSA